MPLAGRARPGSTSSTSTARTPTCRGSSSRPTTTAAATSMAARSRTSRRSCLSSLRPVVGRLRGCTQSHTAGEEYRRGWHPEHVPPLGDPLHALVVGAGPSGMECAITLAKRGARVDLVERGAMAGGSLGWITRLPGLAEWGRLTAYRAVQIARLDNLTLTTDCELDAAQISAWGADVVVLATGSSWSRDGL